MSGIHYTEEERRALIESTNECLDDVRHIISLGLNYNSRENQLIALAGPLCDALDRLGCSEIVVKYRELKETLK